MPQKPKKPTQPFGYFAFGKNGKVRKEMSVLSHDKQQQELGVLEQFLEGLKKSPRQLTVLCYKKLPEADHDFLIKTNEGEIHLQITEIVKREYAFPISKKDYNSGKYAHCIAKKSGEIPWAVDIERLNTSLKRAIQHKIEKHYSKPEKEVLWLLVFSTCIHPVTVFSESGKKGCSQAIIVAREYLRNIEDNVFDQIWHTNLLLPPVKIWPEN